MSRSVKDLRDLICVSRLTIRESDDEEPFSDDGLKCQDLGGNVDFQNGLTDASHLMSTPDSGFCTNGVNASDSQDSDDELKKTELQSQKNVIKKASEGFRTHPEEERSNSSTVVNGKKRKPKLRPAQTSVSEQSVSKFSHSRLYSAQKAASLLKSDLLAVSHHRVNTQGVGDRSATPSADFADGHFEKLFLYIDGAFVSEWLEQSNKNVLGLTNWCHAEENFVQFAHFWLSLFPDKDKFEIFRLEHRILLDQLSFAFAAGLNCEEIQQRHLSMFLNAIYHEYPAKLMSSRGPHLFLDYLDILSSSKKLAYKRLLSNVRCSSRTQQHIQWILATRSFALISVWSSVVNFYKKLNNNCMHDKRSVITRQETTQDDGHLDRMFAAISHGYADVVYYFLKSGKVSPGSCDGLGKSLVFYAVMYKQPKIVKLLLSQTNYECDGNLPAINGNTPLHAAVNGGSKELVQELLACDKINVNSCNPQCDNATPLHMAILHGHLEIVQILLLHGADRSMKMGTMTVVDVAKEFQQDDILKLLQADDCV